MKYLGKKPPTWNKEDPTKLVEGGKAYHYRQSLIEASEELKAGCFWNDGRCYEKGLKPCGSCRIAMLLRISAGCEE